MADEQTTKRAEVRESFDLYKISVVDSGARADLWMDIAHALVRLGVLATSLRAPNELHRSIHAAASICKARADIEINRSEHYLRAMKATAATAVTAAQEDAQQ